MIPYRLFTRILLAKIIVVSLLFTGCNGGDDSRGGSPEVNVTGSWIMHGGSFAHRIGLMNLTQQGSSIQGTDQYTNSIVGSIIDDNHGELTIITDFDELWTLNFDVIDRSMHGSITSPHGQSQSFSARTHDINVTGHWVVRNGVGFKWNFRSMDLTQTTNIVSGTDNDNNAINGAVEGTELVLTRTETESHTDIIRARIVDNIMEGTITRHHDSSSFSAERGSRATNDIFECLEPESSGASSTKAKKEEVLEFLR